MKNHHKKNIKMHCQYSTKNKITKYLLRVKHYSHWEAAQSTERSVGFKIR